MILTDFKDFIAAIPPAGHLLGIDWGSKRMGLAVSDDLRDFAFPRENVPSEAVMERIIEIIVSEKIVGIVLGLPTHEDGTDSDTTRAVRKFAEKLAAAVAACPSKPEGRSGVPIGLIDERFSSWEANERNPHAKLLDKHAAAIILQDAIAMIKRAKL
ncbi:MAG: Holliday junction resolvase RuvX [Alphaproteobacteria bacterium]|nr:Holliday junction resolvase RuvX [Alphaproteobacteria bacterium]